MAENQNNINKTEEISSAYQTSHQRYSAEDLVSHFIKNYLWPIAMDGKLESNEETPLFLGYRLYYYPHKNSIKLDISSSLKETFRGNLDRNENLSVINSFIKTWNRLICDINDEAVERPPHVHLINAYHWFRLKVREKACKLTHVPPKWESADFFQTKDIIQEYIKLIKEIHQGFVYNPENATKKNSTFSSDDTQSKSTTSHSSSPDNTISTTEPIRGSDTVPPTIEITRIKEVTIEFYEDELVEINSNVECSIEAANNQSALNTVCEFENTLKQRIARNSINFSGENEESRNSGVRQGQGDASVGKVSDVDVGNKCDTNCHAIADAEYDFLFDSCRDKDIDGSLKKVVYVSEKFLPSGDDLWFIGDLHGDLLALETALYYIRKKCNSKGGIVFLGDFFDDGDLSYQLVIRLFKLAADKQERNRICILTGNHDDALKWNEASRCFESSVVPSEFGADLNNRIERGDQLSIRVGEAICRLFDEAPRAVILWDGLLVAHAGIPHTDLQETITLPEHLNSQDCLSDFVWTRAHQRARSRRPNRTTRGCEFGILDFEKFCDLTAKIGWPVKRMLRGHDHVDDNGNRALLYKNYRQNPILTINSLSSKLARELTGPDFRQPCVARWQPDQLPEVHYLKIPDYLILKYNLTQSH